MQVFDWKGTQYVHQSCVLLQAKLLPCVNVTAHSSYYIKRHAFGQQVTLLKPINFAISRRDRSLRVPGAPTATATPTRVLDNIKNSAVLSPSLYTVTSWSYAALCFTAALSSVAAFSAISNIMTGDYSSFLDPYQHLLTLPDCHLTHRVSHTRGLHRRSFDTVLSGPARWLHCR